MLFEIRIVQVCIALFNSSHGIDPAPKMRIPRLEIQTCSMLLIKIVTMDGKSMQDIERNQCLAYNDR